MGSFVTEEDGDRMDPTAPAFDTMLFIDRDEEVVLRGESLLCKQNVHNAHDPVTKPLVDAGNVWEPSVNWSKPAWVLKLIPKNEP
jgi:hypothetical protein